MQPCADKFGSEPPGGASTACLTQQCDILPFQIDHIRALRGGGTKPVENLALSCLACNAHKGPNLSGVDPENGSVVMLFDPRHDVWDEHFYWDRARLVGRTATGRAAIAVLAMSARSRVDHRRLLIETGQFVV